jgi:VIT1/CCC1 family predicted Fe2+/Mn2+ transporter
MKIVKLKSFFSEFFLIASVIYYWVLTSNLLNPFAIGLLAILIYQVISKKSTLGLIISSIVICLTLFMVLALISELSEFEVVNQNYKNLILFGSLYLGFTLIMAGLMFYKYLKLKIN